MKQAGTYTIAPGAEYLMNPAGVYKLHHGLLVAVQLGGRRGLMGVRNLLRPEGAFPGYELFSELNCLRHAGLAECDLGTGRWSLTELGIAALENSEV